jgi:hypothetical protein
LSFLSVLQNQELAPFVGLLRREFIVKPPPPPHHTTTTSTSGSDGSGSDGSDYTWASVDLVQDVRQVRRAVHVGFVNMFKDTVQQLGFKAIPFLNTSLSLVLSLLRMSYEDLHHSNSSNNSNNSNDTTITTNTTNTHTLGLSESKKLRSTCYRIFLLVFTTFSQVPLPTATVMAPLKQILAGTSVHVGGTRCVPVPTTM